jgi:hypothetical protein
MLGIKELIRDGAALPPVPVLEDSGHTASTLSTPEEKITLFRSLFRGREDIYAVRWEGRGGRWAIRQPGSWTGVPFTQ